MLLLFLIGLCKRKRKDCYLYQYLLSYIYLYYSIMCTSQLLSISGTCKVSLKDLVMYGSGIHEFSFITDKGTFNGYLLRSSYFE